LPSPHLTSPLALRTNKMHMHKRICTSCSERVSKCVRWCLQHPSFLTLPDALLPPSTPRNLAGALWYRTIQPNCAGNCWILHCKRIRYTYMYAYTCKYVYVYVHYTYMYMYITRMYVNCVHTYPIQFMDFTLCKCIYYVCIWRLYIIRMCIILRLYIIRMCIMYMTSVYYTYVYYIDVICILRLYIIRICLTCVYVYYTYVYQVCAYIPNTIAGFHILQRKLNGKKRTDTYICTYRDR